MNFLNEKNSILVLVCLFLLQLSGCYAGPVRSPRTSALQLRNILTNMQRVTRSDQPSLRQDYYIPSDEEGDLAVTANESFIDPPTTEDFGVGEPESINDTVFSIYLPAADVSEETEQPAALALDADIVHNGLPNSDSIDTVTASDIQGVIEAESTQKLEEPFYSKTVAEQEPPSDNLVPQAPIETSELYHSPTVAAPSDPTELPLMYPLVRVPTAPLVKPISVADLPLETFVPSTAALPEKVEISSSPEAQDHSSAISELEQGDNVGTLPLDLNPKVTTQISSSSIIFDSQIQVNQSKCYSNTSYDRITIENPNEKNGSSTRSSGSTRSTPKLRQLGRELGFPPISNTQDNFNVQVNWDKFM